MRKISYVILAAVLFLSACNNVEYKKGKDGLEYKIISNGSGTPMKIGDFMQIHVGQYYATGKTDSVLSDSRTNGGPMIELFDSAVPPAYFDILKQLKNGDSLVMRILTDSAFSKSHQEMPAFFKKGHYLTTTVKVLNIFTSREAADSARKAEMIMSEKQDSIKAIAIQAKDEKTIKDYLAKNNINAVRSPAGTYVQIIDPGTGNNIDTTIVVSVNYTGRTMDGKMFDSNTDSTKGHVEPLKVNMSTDRTLGGNVIKGWTDGLTLLKKGAVAKFFIPSPLAYGPRQMQDIPANSILVFDIKVIDLFTKDQFRAEMKVQAEQFRVKQKAFMDSMKKAKSMADTNKLK